MFLNAIASLLCLTAPLDDLLTLEDIVQGLLDREQAFQNFTVTATYQMLTRPLTGDQRKLISLRAVETYTTDTRGRLRSTGIADQFDRQSGVHHVRMRGAFDGNQARMVEGTEERDERARISPRSQAVRSRTDPWSLVSRHFGKPVSHYIRQDGGRIAGEKEFDGRRVVMVETSPVTNEGEWKHGYWIDCARGFAVVRKAAIVKMAPDRPWIEYNIFEAYDHEEVSPGLWLPRRLKHESYTVTEKQPAVLDWRWLITTTDWSVNTDLPDSVFQLQIPPGVFVNDEITGRTYESAKITDENITANQNEARRLRDLFAQLAASTDEVSSWPRIGVWVALTVGGVVVLLTWIVRRRRPKVHPT